MLDKEIEKAVEPLAKMYSEVETELLKKIVEHLLTEGEFQNSDYWRIQKLKEMGAFNKEVVDYLAKISKKTPPMIKKLLKDINITTNDYSGLRAVFEEGIITVNPTDLLEDPIIQLLINNHYNEMNNTFIEMSDKIAEATRRTYLSIVEKSALEMSMGAKSYDEVIQEAITELSNNGITTLDYTTDGKIRHYDISGTVRREVLTQARQLSGEISVSYIDELKPPYVKLSEHLDCRESHLPWQGTIVPTEEWKEITDYGSITGIYGINCRHYVECYWGDKRGSEEKKLGIEECEEAYALSQKQRYLERGLRKWKREMELQKVAEDAKAYKHAKEKVVQWGTRLDNFSDDFGYQRDYTREYI